VTFDSILGWGAIGAAASLAGMIWPFRRGTLGVVVNLVAGIAGALLGGVLSSVALRPAARQDGALTLFFAAAGALIVLGIVHAVWPKGHPSSRARDQSDVAHRRPVA
jgi:uncharacterized membrane protein YeaQ/YmgE (transglycosylase-associated protein family)